VEVLFRASTLCLVAAKIMMMKIDANVAERKTGPKRNFGALAFPSPGWDGEVT